MTRNWVRHQPAYKFTFLPNAKLTASRAADVRVHVPATVRVQRALHRFGHRYNALVSNRPQWATAALLVLGLGVGVGGAMVWQQARMSTLQTQVTTQVQQTEQIRRGAQRELNAMSTRLAELQAQATRLNAVGQRLVDAGGLADGEFNFNAPVGQGGGGPSTDMRPVQMRSSLGQLESEFNNADAQFRVLDRLLSSRTAKGSLERAIAPTSNSYVTSTFGNRADPFGAGAQFHKGIDFAASVGDPVYAVADGVVSFVGVRTGYGNVVEVDHGNGYVTRYAHNSVLTRQVGDVVRAGTEIAKAGSTGRSTGAHVHLEVWKDGAYVNPAPFLAGRSSVKRG